MYHFKSYQLWESPVKGFISKAHNDFVIFNKDGISFVRLSENEPRRTIHGESDIQMILHSIYSADFLKIEESNLVYVHKE